MQFVKKGVILNYVMFGGLITNYVSYFTGFTGRYTAAL